MSLRGNLHENKDLVIGASGAVVLTILVVLLFFVRGVAPGPGPGGAGSGIYDVTFQEEEHDVTDLPSEASGTLDEGESVDVAVEVTAPNVTAFSAQLTWPTGGTGDINPDTFSIEVQGPSDQVTCDPSTKQGESGSLTLECTGVSVPEDVESIAASSEDDALARAAKERPAKLGATGTYTVTITLEDAGPEPTDSSNEYDLTATYTDYHAHATKLQDA